MTKIAYAHQKDARQKNTWALWRDLWHNGPLSRAKLAERNGLTKATVSAICHELEALDLICEDGQDRTRPGRPGNLLLINPSARCAIGVEIGTHYALVALTDLRAEALWRRSALFPVGSDQTTVLHVAETLIGEAIEQAHHRAIPLLGIGVGVPGNVAPGPNSLVHAPALGWNAAPLKPLWQTRFAAPVVIENKARVAAMAEAFHGSAKGANDFIYVSVGADAFSTVEAAVVTNGSLYRGAQGMAVDAGHMILDPNGPLCLCGQRGCWQALVAAAREVSAVLGAHVLGITNLVRLFDPALVVISHVNAGQPETDQARTQALAGMPDIDYPAAVRGRLADRAMTLPDIRSAAYGAYACTVGAATLLVDEVLWLSLKVGS